MRTTRLVLLGLAAAICVALTGRFAEPRWQNVFIMWSLWSVMGMGWLLVLRVGGISIGQVAFLAVAAYSAVVLTLKLNLPVWPSILVGGLVSAGVAYLIGIVVMRLRGVFFITVSFCLAEVIRLGVSTSGWLGGSEGMWGMPIPGDIGPVTFASKAGWVYVFFLLVVITGLICWRIEKSRTGRIYTAVGVAPALAQSLGLHLMKYRVQALVVSAFTTGLAGAMQAHYIRAVGPDAYTLWPSLVAMIVAVIGGVNHLVLGPLAGALLFALLDDVMAFAPGIRMAVYGVTLLVIIFLLPEGLLSLPKRLRRLRRRKEVIVTASG